MSGSSSERSGYETGAERIVEMTTRLMIHIQQDPGRGGDEWPNVTMQQLRVMMILYSEGPTRVSVLARRLKVSTPTVTGILDRLVRQDLTFRSDDPHDRRVVLNSLTDSGRQIIEQLQPIDEQRLVAAVNRLSPDQQSSLAEALGELVRAVESTVETANHA